MGRIGGGGLIYGWYPKSFLRSVVFANSSLDFFFLLNLIKLISKGVDLIRN